MHSARSLRNHDGTKIMTRERQLSMVLSQFARTMLTDFPIQGILDQLVISIIVGVLPISSAGVTLISPSAGPRYVAASDDSALRYEELQTELGEGPLPRRLPDGRGGRRR